MSSMRCVVSEPPVMLTVDTSTDRAPSHCAEVEGTRPPPMMAKPPTAVKPDTAFVTAIRGECSAGATPQTTLYPTMPANASVPVMLRNAGSADATPMPSTPTMPPVSAMAVRMVGAYRSVTASSSAAAGFAGACWPTLAIDGGGGGGHMSSPPSSTVLPRTTSSSMSMAKVPATGLPASSLPVMDSSSLEMLFAYSVLLCVGSRLGRSVYPTQVTPPWRATWPGWVVSTLPPASAARSTTTLPGRMDSTMAREMSLGAGLPGMSAVVMTTSTSRHCSANSFISASINSLLISLA
mmetsp:Transcript_19190/g.61044  ORF Transcript_19190/g.61044 Transcript_19190/m.61044 type:complete len:294 (+) Transcript_19190:1971-2852(+)